MTLKDQIKFVRQNMKKNKSRIFMTMLATAIGCAFLIVLASIGFGLHKSIIQELMEDRLVTEIEVHAQIDDKENYKAINDRHIEYFEALDDVKAVTRRQMLQQTPIYELGEYSIQANTFSAFFPAEVKAGFELSEGRLPEKSDEIIVGYSFLNELAKKVEDDVNPYNDDGTVKEKYAFKESLIGKTVSMEVKDRKDSTTTIPLTIVGIAKKPAKDWLTNSDVFISDSVLKDIEAFTGTRGGSLDVEEKEMKAEEEKTYDQVNIYTNSVQDVEGIIEKLDMDRYATFSIVNEMKQVNMIFTIMKIGLILVGTIALIIASIGIYNTMTMAVTERAPDIGIMKAIGANPSTIKKIFLLESSYIGLIGALVGTVVAYGVSFAVNFSLPIVVESMFNEAPPENLLFSYIPWTLALISIAICLIITIFSGWRPAQRATRIDVLQAMRREI
ncbi:ABC transporter permease YtrF [Siminovitchia terrae]|uniref:ABC transporter permease YtrF n=1 Tax=Siminovitchia terrae TaxID=1914933 RepID=A0ABQ4KZS9_SIMTE|nr:FtsX-like permease family protein [Siminovitchia terrae]GIN92924.1 ABC transporter permease YtrF [Siminovitchia terrae]GIN97525.1 ABC transporter permease YtrF [Siminovitchia terrae]